MLLRSGDQYVDVGANVGLTAARARQRMLPILERATT
jgi:hypothetical protein